MINVSIQIDESSFIRSVKRAVNNTAKEISRSVGAISRSVIRSSATTVLSQSVARFAPDRETETYMLTGGYPADERTFRKSSATGDGFLYVQDAIYRYAKFGVKDNIGSTRYTAEIYITPNSYEKINKEIGFGWLKFKKGSGGYIAEERSTLDVAASDKWDNLLGMWEDGGTIVAKPRDGKFLYPDSNHWGTRETSITKTIKPFRMFDRGMNAKAIDTLVTRIFKDIKTKYGGK